MWSHVELVGVRSCRVAVGAWLAKFVVTLELVVGVTG